MTAPDEPRPTAAEVRAMLARATAATPGPWAADLGRLARDWLRLLDWQRRVAEAHHQAIAGKDAAVMEEGERLRDRLLVDAILEERWLT